MNALDLAKMRQDRRKHSVAITQPHRASTVPPPTATPITIPRPSAAAPAQSLNRPQTIRFTTPTFTQPRNKRFSSATTLKPSGKGKRRADSLVPPNAPASTQEPPRRKSTIASLFWEPRVRVTTGEAPSYDVPANQDPEPGSTRKSGREKHQSFLARCKRDKLMHTVLGMVLLFCGGLIVAGVIWTVTRQNRVLEDSRNFVCGKGIAGGPKCAVHLKAEKSSVESAGYVGGEVVDWWLKNHCVWQGGQGEWLCGSNIGQKESKGSEVLPQGTWFERSEEKDDAQT